MRKTPQPVEDWPRFGGLTALRHDLAFAVGVVIDVLRGRPFAS